MNLITNALAPDTVVFLAANKIDLTDDPVVDWNSGIGPAKAQKAQLFRVSALIGDGVYELFYSMAEEMAKRNREQWEAPGFQNLEPEGKGCGC
jgi:50S ribosomal subunit-associated GTPase HflX